MLFNVFWYIFACSSHRAQQFHKRLDELEVGKILLVPGAFFLQAPSPFMLVLVSLQTFERKREKGFSIFDKN